jgi:hypothetical protein
MSDVDVLDAAWSGLLGNCCMITVMTQLLDWKDAIGCAHILLVQSYEEWFQKQHLNLRYQAAIKMWISYLPASSVRRALRPSESKSTRSIESGRIKAIL